ncbi:MAG TPA: hypothetical protein VGG64_04860 [Pirellulales bacterium]|jgi:hypothetical protein
MPTKKTTETTTEHATSQPTAGGVQSMVRTLADWLGLRPHASLHDDEGYAAAWQKLQDLNQQADKVQSDLQGAYAVQRQATTFVDSEVAALLADNTFTQMPESNDQKIKTLEHQLRVFRKAVELQSQIVTKAEYDAGRRLVEKYGLRTKYEESLRDIHRCLIALEAACQNETAVRESVHAISGGAYCPPQPYRWRPEPLDDINGRGSIWLAQARECGYTI